MSPRAERVRRRSRKPIGLIGLGLLGNALVARFLQAGFPVVGFDIDPARRKAFQQLGGKPVASAAEVSAVCQRVVLALPNSDVVRSVVQAMGRSLTPGSTLIDTTTGEPAQTVKLGKALAKRRIRYLDATVVGSSLQARAGEVIVLVGGPPGAFAGQRDLLGCFARESFHVGPCGAGARMKLVVNLVLGLNRAVLAEGLAFARRAGVSPAEALKVLKAGAAYSKVMDTKGGKMLKGDFTPQARLAQHLKDVRLILKLGARAKAKLPLSQVHCRLLARLAKGGFAEDDNSAIIKAFE